MSPSEQEVRDLVRDLRAVGTEEIKHDYAGVCPNVAGEGPSTATDRDNLCPACRVLLRADAMLLAIGEALVSAPPCLIFVAANGNLLGPCYDCGRSRAAHVVSPKVETLATMPTPWTEAHLREALRAVLRHCDAAAAKGPLHEVARIEIGPRYIVCERAFRATLASFGLTPARINHEVRRVRDLAEGRLVRSEIRGYRVATPGGGRSNVVTKQQALDGINPTGTNPRPGYRAVPVRVARIRRPS